MISHNKINQQILGVIGDPIEHSLSPALFEFVLDELGLPYRYEAFRVRAEELGAFLQRVREEGFLGLNVTIPHKERVIPLLDGLDPQAERLGAVNTITNEARRLMGHNTDVEGFIRSLRTRGIELRGQRAVILGAGGAAKAAVYGLIELGIGGITLANRTLQRAQDLSAQVASKTGFQEITSLKLDDPRLGERIQGASMLVNATSAGMAPKSEACPLGDLSCLHRDLIVYDLIYNPPETKLLEGAKGRAAQAINGLDMLIYQALGSLNVWLRWELAFSERLIEKVRAGLLDHLAHKAGSH